jgi:hypothetical protein
METKVAIRRILKFDYYSGVYLIVLGIVSLILGSLLICLIFLESPKDPPPYHWPLLTLLAASLGATEVGMWALLLNRVRRIRRVLSIGKRIPGLIRYNFYADFKGLLWRYHGGGMLVYEFENDGADVVCWTATWRSDVVEAFEPGREVTVAIDPMDPDSGIIADWYG